MRSFSSKSELEDFICSEMKRMQAENNKNLEAIRIEARERLQSLLKEFQGKERVWKARLQGIREQVEKKMVLDFEIEKRDSEKKIKELEDIISQLRESLNPVNVLCTSKPTRPCIKRSGIGSIQWLDYNQQTNVRFAEGEIRTGRYIYPPERCMFHYLAETAPCLCQNSCDCYEGWFVSPDHLTNNFPNYAASNCREPLSVISQNRLNVEKLSSDKGKDHSTVLHEINSQLPNTASNTSQSLDPHYLAIVSKRVKAEKNRENKRRPATPGPLKRRSHSQTPNENKSKAKSVYVKPTLAHGDEIASGQLVGSREPLHRQHNLKNQRQSQTVVPVTNNGLRETTEIPAHEMHLKEDCGKHSHTIHQRKPGEGSTKSSIKDMFGVSSRQHVHAWVDEWRVQEEAAEQEYLDGPRLPLLPSAQQGEHTLEQLWEELEVSYVHRRDLCVAAARAMRKVKHNHSGSGGGINSIHGAVVATGDVAQRLATEAEHLEHLLPRMGKQMQVSCALVHWYFFARSLT